MLSQADGKCHCLLGVTPNDSVFALDPQSWSVLALGVRPEWAGIIDWTGPLERAADQLGAVCEMAGLTVEGFDFGRPSEDGTGEPDGVWLEGTAQMAAAYGAMGQ